MSRLILIPTPIGNLEDITFRAVRVLSEVDLVLAEDTRNTLKLLSHFNISKPIWSYHQHNEHQTTAKIVEEISAGKTIALVSDAGTPGISDPGYLLLRACLDVGIEIETLPGPTALIPALVNSGLPCDRFVFEGFLPHKKGRQTRLNQLTAHRYTFVLYESPHRLLKTLAQLIELFGPEHPASVSRELSKIHEETVRGGLQEIVNYYQTNTLKGEFVIVCGAIQNAERI
ncbi:MAG: 16S rRNA (cytidine(1402)-2'-O)-methyltransferase [Bacteroidales bacterium]|nr:16S rRNA (cytidine(1402)-2'-O)-methyltransferase [Bacteroidales bacterium]